MSDNDSLPGGYQLYRNNNRPDVFEIGLVLAGAVSAGSYQAGVLDFLIEALDAWEEQKATHPGSVPSHRVEIKVVSAASAGAMNAAILAVAGRYEFPHVSSRLLGTEPFSRQSEAARARIDEQASRNPFFKPWVQDISIDRLLTTRDLADGKPLVSLLDCTELAPIVRAGLQFGVDGQLETIERRYLASPTRYIFTVCNLQGVPYRVKLNAGAPSRELGHAMRSHRDHLSFSISYNGGEPRTVKDDDLALDWSVRASNPDQGWRDLGLAALASGAFPVGLSARGMERLKDHYGYRFVTLVMDNQVAVKTLEPDFRKAEEPFRSFLLDGGTMNNEPLDLARAELVGVAGSLPTCGDGLNQALLLIDPFPDSTCTTPTLKGQTPELFSAISDLLGAWKNQARFSPSELLLAEDDCVYSRYLIAPRRAGKGEPLACGALGGFGGFLHRDFRQHDYLLGRRNAQKFLSDHFTMPAHYKLFEGRLPEKELLAPWERVEHGVACLPIIPLMPSLAVREDEKGQSGEPVWPADSFRMESIEADVRRRMDAIVDRLVSDVESRWTRWGARSAYLAFGSKARKQIRKYIVKGLEEHGLMGDMPAGRVSPQVDHFADRYAGL